MTVDEKIMEVRLALLETLLKGSHTPSNVLKFAEAYAWVSYPNNAHGASPGEK